MEFGFIAQKSLLNEILWLKLCDFQISVFGHYDIIRTQLGPFNFTFRFVGTGFENNMVNESQNNATCVKHTLPGQCTTKFKMQFKNITAVWFKPSPGPELQHFPY